MFDAELILKINPMIKISLERALELPPTKSDKAFFLFFFSFFKENYCKNYIIKEGLNVTLYESNAKGSLPLNR